MSGFSQRGGSPFAMNLTATTTGAIQVNGVAASLQPAGAPIAMPGPTTWLRIAATTNAVRVYFNQADFTADQRYLPVPAAGFVEVPFEVTQLWLRGVAGTSVVDIFGALKT